MRPLATSNFQNMLENPIYYGVIRYKGEHFDGKHEPLISKTLFDAVQEAIIEKSKPKSSGKKTYLYRGLSRCVSCGCFITTETQKGNNYLRCTKRKGACGEPYAREGLVNEQVRARIAQVALPADVVEDMLKEIESDREVLSENVKESVKTMKREISECDSQLSRLLEFLLNRIISDDEYRNQKERLIKAKAERYETMTRLEADGATRFEPLTEFVKSLKQATFLTFQQQFCRKSAILENHRFELPSWPKTDCHFFQKPLENRSRLECLR